MKDKFEALRSNPCLISINLTTKISGIDFLNCNILYIIISYCIKSYSYSYHHKLVFLYSKMFEMFKTWVKYNLKSFKDCGSFFGAVNKIPLCITSISFHIFSSSMLNALLLPQIKRIWKLQWTIMWVNKKCALVRIM